MEKDWKKILITGVNGFLGRNITEQLREEFILVGLDTGPDCLTEGVDSYIQMTLPDAGMDEVIRITKPSYCIHCAGCASVGLSVAEPGVDFQSGPVVTFGLVDSIRKAQVDCRVIFFSSAAVYGNPVRLPIREDFALKPVSPYGCHKMMCEQILEEFGRFYGLEYVIFRVFSCYGKDLRKQLLWDVCNKIKNSDCTLFGTGNETRDFIHVSDVAKLAEFVIKKQVKNRILNVASAKPYTIRQVVRMVATEMAYPVQRIAFDGRERQGDPKHWQADICRIRSLGFTPLMSLEKGIEEYAQWFESIHEQCHQHS